MMGWYSNSWSSTGGVATVMMLVLCAAVLAVLVWGVARLTRTEQAVGRSVEDPRSILDRRFAAGDIDAEQYMQARRLLEGAGVASADLTR